VSFGGFPENRTHSGTCVFTLSDFLQQIAPFFKVFIASLLQGLPTG
jgi:hypothetical protein